MTAACTVAAEVGVRRLDGYAVFSQRLERERVEAPPSDTERAMTHMRQLPVANGVDRAWFSATPEPPAAAGREPVIEEQFASNGRVLPPIYEWNLRGLERLACRDRATFNQRYGAYEHLFVYEPPDGQSTLPSYRFLRRASYPNGLVTNAFGWRGTELALNKPERTIRLAFVGSSTTVGGHGTPSYPEFIGVWLNLWSQARGSDIRYEIINAAREGISSDSIAAVVEQEVLPMEPDMVLYYEGANQFWPGDYIEWPDRQTLRRPAEDPRATPAWRAEAYSGLVVRLRVLFERFFGSGREPAKPYLKVAWPDDVDEDSPPLDSAKLPVGLPLILSNLESIRVQSAKAGAELVMETFFWLVWDGMVLDPVANSGPHAYLNKTFWPFTYAHMRRVSDFQNRVFTKYARSHGLGLIDVAARFPKDPAMFGDAIHFTAEGTRLQGWVVLQGLIPILEERLKSGALPQMDKVQLAKHPAFLEEPRRMMRTSQIAQTCGAQ